MSWYKIGTVNVTKNSKIVTGVGTKWTNQLSGVSAGRMLILQISNQIDIYEIESVQSDTQLTLSDNYSGETIKGLKYTIPTSPSVSIEQFALEIASSLAYHQKQLDGWQKILTGSGDVTLTAPDGQKVTIKSQKSLSSAIDNAVKKSGDTMTGQLTLSQYGVKLPFDNGNMIALKISSDNYSHIFYDSETQQRTSILVYNPTKNEWNFPYVNDVTINNKSVLKTGDAIQTFGDLSTTINLNELTGSNEGIYYQGRNTSAVTERGYPINQAGTLQVFKNGADGAGCCQIYTTYRNARQFIRNYRGGTKTWEEWSEVITTANSTVDSNGFLKKASPILRLFANNNIEEVGGFKKSGCALVNDFAYGVTATRIDVGHYEIHGSLGFAKRGWYITLPEDANGNKKFFAEYSVDENNIITVKTYTKKFDFESCQIVAGKPIDITDGRWVDVRLEMPVIEVIENEEPIPSTLNPVIVSEVPDDI